jgi:hypothetical protein
MSYEEYTMSYLQEYTMSYEVFNEWVSWVRGSFVLRLRRQGKGMIQV